MRMYDVCGIGHALVDVLVRISEEEFDSLGLQRSSSTLAPIDAQKATLEQLGHHSPRLVGGGSIANSIFALSQLRAKTALMCILGDDPYGVFYHGECSASGIHLPFGLNLNGTTGTCLVLITPDGERTMRTSLGIAGAFRQEDHLDESVLSHSTWLFLEGYLLANPGIDPFIHNLLEKAKRAGCKIALTCSDAWVIELFGELFNYCVRRTDLLFANELEGKALIGKERAEESFVALKRVVPNVVVTAGERGAFCRLGNEEVHVPAFSCQPKDLTGAGDMFAAAFLYGVTHDLSLDETARAACYLAMKVISQIGARLTEDLPTYWKEASKG